MPHISIIIPIYKLATPQIREGFEKLVRHLSIAISHADRSLFVEIIVINDKPEDIVDNVVEDIFFANDLKDLLFFKNNPQTLGQAATRNTGARHAKGKYLHFIDQDDYINSDFYSSFSDLDEKDITIALPISYYLETDSLFYTYRARLIKLYEKTNYIKDLKWFLVSNIAISPGQYIISRETFLKNGMYPDLKNRGCDDYGLLFNLTLDDNCSMIFNSSMLFYYTIHKEQNRNSLDMKASLIEFYNTLNKSMLPISHKFMMLRTSSIFSNIFKLFLASFFIKRPNKGLSK